MPELMVNLFGTPSVQVDGREVGLPYRKAEALLYYLVMERRAPRQKLVELLWEDAEPTAARKNLRHAVYTVRRALGLELFAPGQRAVLELDPQLSIRCDVLDFLQTEELEAYGGEFLAGFALPGCGAFEEWLGDQRRRLRSRYLQKLLAAEQAALATGDLERAEQLGLEYIARDALEEGAYVVLMEVYSRQKKFRKAIGIYHQLCKSLEAELSIAPLKETTALYYHIVNEWNSSTYRIEEQSDHPIFGKEGALRSLLAVCNRPLSERGCPCLLLEGEAGVGKTYLLDHVLNQYDLSDRLVLRACCYPSESGVPLAPWNSIMLGLLAELEVRRLSIPDTYLRTAAGLFPCLALKCGQGYTSSDGNYPLQHNYHAAQESTLLILSLAARQVPLLLVLEDIHWIDSTSVELLSAVLRRLRSLNVTVIATARELTGGYLQNFAEQAQRDKLLKRSFITALSREETGQFVRHYLGRAPTPEQLDQIYQGTGGNALLLTQLMDALWESGEEPDMAQMLKGVLDYRLAQLTVEELQVLELIAAFSEWAPMEALSSILTKDAADLMCLCGQLTQRMLVAELERDGEIGYTLAHDRIRGVLVQRQPESARRILHLRVAQYLESRLERQGAALYDRLAYHYEAGGNRLKALHYRVLSLDAFTGLCFDLLPTLSAQPDGAQPDAEGLPGYFRGLEEEVRALRRLSADREELDRLELTLLHAKSRYCIYTGRYGPGLEALEQLTALCRARGETRRLVEIHLQYIYYGLQTYDTGLMGRHLDAGRALLAGQEQSEHYGVYLRLAGLLEQMQGHYPRALELLEQSIRTLEALVPASDDRYAINIAGAYNYMAECFRLEGQYEEACRYYDQAILRNRGRGRYPGTAVFYTNYGVCAFQMGEETAAHRLFSYAVEIYRSSHEYSGYPLALGYLALYDARAGDYSGAADKLRQAHSICDVIGSPWWKGVVIYLSWQIRRCLDQTGQEAPELRTLWPDREREHCAWGLRYLEQISPRQETQQLRQRLEQL